MRRPTSTRQRARARRAAEPALRRRAGSDDVLAPEQHAQRIATLRAEKRKLSLQLERVNELLDNALIAARVDNVKHAAIAYAVQHAEGRPSTAEDLEQLEAELRKATHHARRRRDPQRIETALDGHCARRETKRMRNSNTPYRRRVEVTEEWYGEPPPEELGTPAAPTLVGDEGLEGVDEDDLDDEDLDDEDDDEDEDDR